MKSTLLATRRSMSLWAGSSMSKHSRRGERGVVCKQIGKMSAAHVVAEVAAQVALNRNNSETKQPVYKIVALPRAQAEAKLRRYGSNAIILGAGTIPPEKLLRKIQQFTPLSNVEGIDKFFPNVDFPVVSVGRTPAHPLAVSKLNVFSGAAISPRASLRGVAIDGPSFGRSFSSSEDGGGGAYTRAHYARKASKRSKSKTSGNDIVLMVIPVHRNNVCTLEGYAKSLGETAKSSIVENPFSQSETNTSQATPTQLALPSYDLAKAEKYCTYSVPNMDRSRDEIEDDLWRDAPMSADVFAKLLMGHEKKGYLDFRGEPKSAIFQYLKERYHLTYGFGNFRHYFKLPAK